MVCWHVGMGMGLYGVKALRLGYEQRQQVPRFFRPDDLNVPDVQQRVHWDPEWARRAGQPRDLRLRPHARDVARPPLHRLDGRRRVAVEARLPVPEVQLRRRHALDARPGHAQVPRRRRPPRGRARHLGREPAGRDDDARPRHDPAARAASTARCASPTRRVARPPAPTRSPRSSTGSQQMENAMKPYPTPPDGLVVEHDGPVLRLRLDRPDRRNAITDDIVARAHRDDRGRRQRRVGPGHRALGHGRPLLLGLRSRTRGQTRQRSRAPATTQRQMRWHVNRLIPHDARDPDADRHRGHGLRHRARPQPRARRPTSRSSPTTPASRAPFTGDGVHSRLRRVVADSRGSPASPGRRRC